MPSACVPMDALPAGANTHLARIHNATAQAYCLYRTGKIEEVRACCGCAACQGA